MDHGLSWDEYILRLDPPMVSRIRVCRFLGIRKGWKVLDVGCGMGGSTIAAASLVGRDGKLVATDKSEEAMRETERLLRKLGLLDRVE